MSDKLKGRIESEAQAMQPVLNSQLMCKDCMHRTPRTDICAVYTYCKPLKVLDGGKCEHYYKDYKFKQP